MLNQRSSECNPPVPAPSRDPPMSSRMSVGNDIPPSPIPVSLSSSLPVYLWGSNTHRSTDIAASTPLTFVSTSTVPAIVSTPPAIVSTPPAIVSTSLSLASSSYPLPAPCIPLGYDPYDPGSWLDDDTLSSILDGVSCGDLGVTSAATAPTVQLQTPPIMQPQTQHMVQPQTQAMVQPQTQAIVQPQTQPMVQPQTQLVVRPQTLPMVQPQTPPTVQPHAQPIEHPVLRSPGIALARVPGKDLRSFRKLAIVLARGCFFGDNVLFESTVSGRGTSMLEPTQLQILIKETIQSRVCDMPMQEFELVWAKCLASIGKKCQNMRTGKLKKYTNFKPYTSFFWLSCRNIFAYYV